MLSTSSPLKKREREKKEKLRRLRKERKGESEREGEPQWQVFQHHHLCEQQGKPSYKPIIIKKIFNRGSDNRNDINYHQQQRQTSDSW